jgi:nitrite reductase/ring-hydroxylating ferredoxin subunit/thioredoxin reductase
MGSEKQELEGPDLTQGVPLDELGEGVILTGHANGEPVVVVRAGGEVFALDANCTHYGVPLGGGVVVDGTLRCPAHHSRFDLRTGEAVAAPALRPAGCWATEERDGRVFVTGKRAATTAAPAIPSPAGMPSSVVIVGAGAAGSACAEMLRREGFAGTVTMIDATPDGPVDRPNLSKDYLAGNAPEEWIPLFPPEWYAQNRIDLVLGTRVTGIDTAERRVKLMNGRTFEYDALLIATGSEPVRLPMSQREVPHLFYLRTLADSRAIIRAAENAKRAVVVGSSFIGLEVAASLRARGLHVDVVSQEALPLGSILGPELGWTLQRLHEDHGVKFHLKDGVAAIDAKTVTLKSGPAIEADLVVAGIGVRPGIALGQWAGLKVEGGIVVDNMLGRGERFAAAPFFWSTHYDVTVSYVGHAEKWDALEIDGDPRAHDCTAVYRKGGRPLAVATIARDRASLRAEAGMEAGDLATVEAAIRGEAAAAAGA